MAIRVITFDFGNVVGFFDYRPALRKLSAETGISEANLDARLSRRRAGRALRERPR